MLKTITKSIIVFLISSSLNAQNFEETTIGSGLPELGNSNMAWGDYDRDGDYDVLISGIDDLTNVNCCLFKNNGDTTFTNSGVVFSQIYQGDLLFIDFNNDNFLDIAVSGKTEENLKITELYSNNGDGSFSKLLIADIDSVFNSSFAGADFDNDGDIDLLISGTDNSDTRICSILRNNGNNTFQKINIDIEGISNGSIQPADFNNDAEIDLLVFGINNINQRVGNIYLNDGNFNFIKQNNVLPELAYASSDVGDYNQDGFIDFAVTGMNQSGTLVSEIFKNNGNGTYTNINAGLIGLYQSSSKWGDYDNDGDLDLILCGFGDSERYSLLYNNTGNDVFSEVTVVWEDVAQGEISFVDFDNDNKSDIVVSGFAVSEAKTLLYRNLTNVLPENPTAPAETNYETFDNTVTLKWNKGNDNQTQNSGLTYNISVGTSISNGDIVSPGSDLSNGFKYLPYQGNCFTDTFTIINNLPEGKYYWQVQSVDNGFLASDFSQIDSFIVCEPVNLGNDTSICINDTLKLSLGEGTDVVNWYSVKQGLLLSNNFNLNFTVTQTDTVWAELSNDLGCFKTDSITVTPIALPEINLPADTSVCKGTLLTLETGTELDSVNWYSNEGLLAENMLSFSIQINSPDTLWAEVFSELGCVNTDTVAADTLTLPYFSLRQDTAACYSDFIEFSVTGFDSVNWYSLYELLLPNSENITREILQNDTLICETFNSLSCSYTDTIISFVRDLPVANTGNDTIICFNTGITLGANPVATGGTPPYIFLWQPEEDFVNSSEEHPEIFPEESRRYILTVTDYYNCNDDDTIYVSINPETILDVPDNLDVCANQSVILGGNPTATGSLFPYSFNWTPDNSLIGADNPNPSAQPEDTTQYRLIVSTYFCNPDTAYVTVNVKPLPEVSASEDVTIGFGESVIIEAKGAVTYNWYPDLYLDDNTSQSPEASPKETITYTVIGTNEVNCSNSDSLTITVKNDIFIPDLFSPDNDGNNDTFKIYGKGIKDIYLKIFDKNGNVVFESNDKNYIMNTGWDGTKKGLLLPDGAYIWIIGGTYNDGSIIRYKGNRGTVFLIK
ncbi:MAG: hypothetical protein GXO50_03670 [Chlorobi bacterium]|nr:hypothetical protein [Chlorobiota bacterium]